MSAADLAARNRTPSYCIELFTAAATNPFGVRQNYYEDPATFIQGELDRAVEMGYSDVTIRNPGGKKYLASNAYDLSCALDWPNQIGGYFLTQFKQDCEDRNLTAGVYGGASWPSASTAVGVNPPVPDPDLESDEIDRIDTADAQCGFYIRYFDAVGYSIDVYDVNRLDAINDTAGYRYGVNGLRSGIEPPPGDNEGAVPPYSVAPDGLDPVRAEWVENTLFADYLFANGATPYLEAIRPPYPIPATVNARVTFRFSDASLDAIVALGGILDAAQACFDAGWIVQADNSLTDEETAFIAALEPTEIVYDSGASLGRTFRTARSERRRPSGF